MKAKYVIVKSMGLEHAIVFSPIINHSDFKALGLEIVSAGQVFISSPETLQDTDYEPRFQCFGESFTLGIKSRGDVDVKAIELSFRD
jgi:hypothetical protein